LFWTTFLLKKQSLFITNNARPYPGPGIIRFCKREKRIPFEVSIDPFYSDENISYLKKVTSEIDSGKAVLSEHELIEG
jgi:hypothetical protein